MKYPDTIIRQRQAPGMRGLHGEWVPGATTETELRANIQPLCLEDKDLVGGSQLSHQLKVYVPEPGALIAAFETAEADTVLVDSLEYVVVESMSWRGHHTMATLLREI